MVLLTLIARFYRCGINYLNPNLFISSELLKM